VDQDQHRTPLSMGMAWASRITGMGVSFALPPVAGHFADRWLGTRPALLIAGMFVGFAVGIVQLMKITRDSTRGL
jgi:F0F1-type ATP synthase assembly protein I